MSGNSKIVWDQPHETGEIKEEDEEGEREVRLTGVEERIEDGVTDLSHLPLSSEKIFQWAESV